MDDGTNLAHHSFFVNKVLLAHTLVKPLSVLFQLLSQYKRMEGMWEDTQNLVICSLLFGSLLKVCAYSILNCEAGDKMSQIKNPNSVSYQVLVLQ